MAGYKGMRCHAGLTVFCPCSPSGNNFGTGLTRFVRRQLQEENGMDFRIRNVALLFLALVLAAGLASAQPGVTVKQVGSNGAVTQTNVDFSGSNGGPVPKAPTGGANGTFKYWDVLGTGGASTNYFSQPPYLTAPPNPQVAVGPDDIFTIVNRTIARYPNPNAGTGGNNAVGVTNPYNNPPLEYVWLDVWLGIPNTALTSLCPLASNLTTMIRLTASSITHRSVTTRCRAGSWCCSPSRM